MNKQTVIAGKVMAIGPGWCLVQSISGRAVKVQTSEIWRKGDTVNVVDGVVIGRSGRWTIGKTYEV